MPTMNMIFQGLFLTFILLKSTRCSMVFDKLNQNTIYVSTYCPKQKYCEEGTHVMCMYYDHEKTIGHRCKNFVETEITSQLVQQILDIVNEIRSRLATGVERGKDGLVLPRAYGMMRMVWDSELATLAQVLANQCLGGREDLCRATDKFPNPSQSIAIVQFRFPDWEYVRMNNTEKGLSEEKLSFSVDRFLKSLHALRKTASREIIANCPPFQELPDRHLRYYLNLIRGGATHIGCGLSAYTRYHDDGGRQSIRNSVQIVCNISDGPQPLEPVYTTDPPVPGDGYTEDCGCPPGHRESDGCLCEVDPDYTATITATTEPSYFNLHSKFKFKKTNPRAEITTERQRWTDIQLKAQIPQEVETVRSQTSGRSCSDDSMTNCEVKVVVLPILSIKDGPPDKMPDIEQIQPFNNTFEPRHRVVDKLDYSEETFKELTNALTMRPEAKYKSRFIYQKNVPKKVNLDKSMEQVHHDSNIASIKKVQDWFSEEEVDDNQQYDINDDAIHNINITNKETDHKLLDLLNILEQEVKNIELNGNLRHLFDAKMRKIYGTALSAPRDRQQYGNHLRELKNFLKNKFIPHLENEKLADEFDASTKDDEHKVDEHTFSENEMKTTPKNNKADRKYFENLQSKHNNYVDKSLAYTPDQHAYEDHATSDLENNLDYNLNKKHLDMDHQNLEHKFDEDDDYPQETFVIRTQENMAPYNNNDLIEQNAIASKEIEHKNVGKHDNKRFEYDNNEATMHEEVEVNRRRMDDTKKLPDLYKRFNSLERILPYVQSPGRRTQISHNFRRIFGQGNMRPMRLMRPNLADVIRPRFPRHRFAMSLSDTERY